jgi:hypothetical protein
MSISRNLSFALAAAFCLSAAPVAAQNVTPDFGTTVPNSWFVDRYAPASFALSTAHGRDNVLGIGIAGEDRQGYDFYNTQGREIFLHDQAGDDLTGSFSLIADLWIGYSWESASNGIRRSDMWGVVRRPGQGLDDPRYFPILGFTNQDGTGTFRLWDENSLSGWVNLTQGVKYESWNTLQISWSGPTTNVFSYFVNGEFAKDVSGLAGSVGLSGVIMQAKNFGGDYTAEWSNSTAELSTVTPEPASMALVVTGLLGIGLMARRRRRTA